MHRGADAAEVNPVLYHQRHDAHELTPTTLHMTAKALGLMCDGQMLWYQTHTHKSAIRFYVLMYGLLDEHENKNYNQVESFMLSLLHCCIWVFGR